jgi:hypothetical protein
VARLSPCWWHAGDAVSRRPFTDGHDTRLRRMNDGDGLGPSAVACQRDDRPGRDGGPRGLLSLRRVRRLRPALSFESRSKLSDTFRSVCSGKALISSLRLRIAIGAAILGLMTFKPDTAGSSLFLVTRTVSRLVASLSHSQCVARGRWRQPRREARVAHEEGRRETENTPRRLHLHEAESLVRHIETVVAQCG